MENRNCPVCNNVHETLARYPMAVCNQCLNIYKVYNSRGNPVCFGNISLSGGFYSKDLKTGEMFYDDHLCYVNNVECFADEARFGGIVVSAVSH